MKTKFTTWMLIGLTSAALASLPAQAMGKKSSSGASSGISTFEDIALTIAVGFASTNPKYAPILNALGIHTGADVKNFLSGDQSGANFKNVIAYLVMNYAQKNADAANWLKALNVSTFADIQKLLADPKSAIGQDTLFQMAFDFANQNSKYAPWMRALGIKSSVDIANLFHGGGQAFKTNLQQQLITIGIAYLASRTKIGDTVLALVPLLHLGAFQGLDLVEVEQIMVLLGKKA